MEIGAASDVGKIRRINEDSLGYKKNLFVIADGMGGHNAGEIASALAVEEILRRDTAGSDFVAALPDILNQANQVILTYAGQHPKCQGMGTTVAVLKVEENCAWVAHVGDSRVYMWRDGKLSRITRDHSMVEELVSKGTITREEAGHHPHRNVLTKALGVPGEVEAEISGITTATGDRILMCTDGLTSMLTDDEIAGFIAQKTSPQKIADLLVQEANKKGGYDNISVIVVFI